MALQGIYTSAIVERATVIKAHHFALQAFGLWCLRQSKRLNGTCSLATRMGLVMIFYSNRVWHGTTFGECTRKCALALKPQSG